MRPSVDGLTRMTNKYMDIEEIITILQSLFHLKNVASMARFGINSENMR